MIKGLFIKQSKLGTKSAFNSSFCASQPFPWHVEKYKSMARPHHRGRSSSGVWGGIGFQPGFSSQYMS